MCYHSRYMNPRMIKRVAKNVRTVWSSMWAPNPFIPLPEVTQVNRTKLYRDHVFGISAGRVYVILKKPVIGQYKTIMYLSLIWLNSNCHIKLLLERVLKINSILYMSVR